MRETFSKLLVDTVTTNNKTYILSGDHGYALFDPLRKKFPEHFLNAGVAEQNMIGVAAGLAKTGFLPIVYGLGAFIPVRVLEQIKLDICYENLKVVLVGDGAGAVYTTLGVSHQTLEDIAVLRAIPNIQILSPSDKHEMKWSFNQALEYKGPTYIRIGKSDLGPTVIGNISSNGMTFLKKGDADRPIIFATGSMVGIGIKLIENYFPDYSLVSVCKLKPLNETDFNFLKQFSGSIISIEEHNVIGGLGSLLAEVVTSTYPRKVLRLGVKDCFSKTCGTYAHVMKEHGLDLDTLHQTIIERAL